MPLTSRHRLSKEEYERRLPRLRDELLAAQTALHKSCSCAVALILAGAPAAGRSETVNHLLEWLDPKHVSVHALGEADDASRRRPPMWRYWQVLPARGRMTFYFAGWYADYFVAAMDKPAKWRVQERRMVARILQLERMLARDGVRTLKVFLDIGARTQRKRIATLLADKLTRWRVTREDRRYARHHKELSRVARDCGSHTNHRDAPWHVIDGTDEQYRLLTVGQLLRDEMRAGLRRRAHSARSKPRPSADSGSARLRARQAMPESSQDDYDRDLETLQGRLALLVRRRRFRKHALVLAFEGMDAAGKGGAIRRVTHALDARQYQVVPVSAPTPEELSYPYLWRFWRHVPELGRIAIFDRTWYGRVLVERVRGFAAAADWQRAYDEIREFELQLTERNIVVAKFWLQVGKAEQLRRFEERDSDPLKRFKVDAEDWVNRRFYGDYQRAAAEAIRRTDAPAARWSIIDADDKKRARLYVLQVICATLERSLEGG
jgi:polyphosphate:AMP phosphotransferase